MKDTKENERRLQIYQGTLPTSDATCRTENWKMDIIEDGDGHLNIFIGHSDGTIITECGADIGDEHTWAERFTTEGIEKQYQEAQA